MAEVELKLESAACDQDRLIESNLLGTPALILQQHSVYFDTSDHRLFNSGFTLRIRKAGDTRTQTVKAIGASASVFARDEWETPVTGDLPLIDHSSPLLNEFGGIAEDLLVQFEVMVERRVWTLEENGSKIDVALDRGDVIAMERRTPVGDIELELKDGNAADLFILARKIEAIVPVRFAVQSKAERGYRLRDASCMLVKAEPIELDRQAPVTRAFSAIAASCFRQFRLNETILLASKNPGALHQARVALRRLRSAIALFKPILPDDTGKRLSSEFRWLAGILGEARDIDVLMARADGSDLRAHLSAARATACDDALEALASPRARALMLDFNEWLRCGDYLISPATAEIRQSTAVEFAIAVLDKQRRKLKKNGSDLADVDDEKRHEVRKDAKKLRYAAEFFRSLFDDSRGVRRYKKFVAAMETLQDELGALNDLVTGPDVLEQHLLLDHAGSERLRSQGDKKKLIHKAQIALDDMLETKRFWE